MVSFIVFLGLVFRAPDGPVVDGMFMIVEAIGYSCELDRPQSRAQSTLVVKCDSLWKRSHHVIGALGDREAETTLRVIIREAVWAAVELNRAKAHRNERNVIKLPPPPVLDVEVRRELL